ncbi:MAG: hypothetical protein UX38_C0005G0029 [Microgenomates group bacterium GW2011_GWC1_46_16]|uniref:YgjP-like metallopeptidase domain-containing protein n=1 Tax=Candidatus Collierbacteria bacterium RIFOXYD1_FULL_46_26 TaxID=1817732 RepID=A0A1F5FYX0_9BACT|nr:MAG: putative metal-dependent hydrolase [Microgenomates group bacterium GW2011_GWF1_46_12]KKU26526.1 MAG: hypothetical protein UX38_C0005G0029 [Microgenomates group bacterium GW2011_GWC1_46_16]KKU28211.1 MAG: putative metal-dependent hydrolase [Microgenomates group bacterium GW2011_GWF2_46_18]KKU45132.1 MAG: putative metal-dependent hydrolase [Microgenomates group bacterium GW2011_GWB1_46_7]KKU61585.1 MAG: putative metal-dependent hydrolase [Microgenomates group bacterium GW2011_GWE1_47_12]
MQYTLIRSRRHSLSLQIGVGGRLLVRAPFLYPKFLIDRLISQKQAWISKHQTNLAKPRPSPHRFIPDEELKKLIQTHVHHYSAVMGLTPRSLRFTHVKTYWGSCSPKHVLSFNLQLAFTSRKIVEYVVVHELSHLKWRGHGQRFWALVTAHYPATPQVKKQLRALPH